MIIQVRHPVVVTWTLSLLLLRQARRQKDRGRDIYKQMHIHKGHLRIVSKQQ